MMMMMNNRSASSSSSNTKKGTQGDNYGKKQAMKRQKERSMPAGGTSTTHSSSSSSSSPPPPIRPSSSLFRTEHGPPPHATTSSFFDYTDNRITGLARLNIPTPKLKQYYFNDSEYYDVNNTSTTSIILPQPPPTTWESNKKRMVSGWDGGRLHYNNNNKNNDHDKNKNNHDDDNDDNNDTLLEIDRESLYDPKIHLPHAPQDWKGYEAATPLSDYLMQRIGVSGQPITTAEYMRHALTHPQYGYYTTSKVPKKNRMSSSELSTEDDDDEWDTIHDESSSSNNIQTTTSSSSSPNIFGPTGDFVTSPELSSVFGHCLCVWFMTQWQALYRPSKIQFVELGPGKGTLMADILELAHSSKLVDFGRSVTSVHLIETSKPLREEQKATLTRVLGHLVELEFVDDEKTYNNNNNNKSGSDKTDPRTSSDQPSSAAKKSLVNTIRVEWHNDFAAFQKGRDKDVPTMIILQEFLDALPVHQFQRTDEGWRERMIDVVAAEDEQVNREAIEMIGRRFPKDENPSRPERTLIPRLRQVLAPHVTPAVELFLSSNNQYDHFPEGTVVEICPDALLLVEDIVKVLEESTGAALIIDYGEEGTADTLRAFSRHRQVPLTSRPGQVDVTADVDFFAIKNSVLSSSSTKEASTTVTGIKGSLSSSATTTTTTEIHPFGPVPQGEFLMKMGAGDLTMNAIEKDETTEEQAQAMADALKYLVMPEHMGTKFKVLALARKRDGIFGPAGME